MTTAAIPASYFTPRNEVTVCGDQQLQTTTGFRPMPGGTWRSTRWQSAGVRATYEDECFIFDANVSRRYTSLNGDNGATLVLFQMTFKTVGQFGFHAF